MTHWSEEELTFLRERFNKPGYRVEWNGHRIIEIHWPPGSSGFYHDNGSHFHYFAGVNKKDIKVYKEVNWHGNEVSIT